MQGAVSAVTVTLAMAWLAAISGVSTNAAPAQSAPGQAPITIALPAQPAAQGYVGEERCQSCHRAELTQFHKTPHAALTSGQTSQRMNCESCHGPGQAHADAQEAAKGEEPATSAANALIFSFRGTPQENAARCQSCHVSARNQQGFGHSSHLAVGVSCQTCHATHLVEAAYPDRLRAPPLPQAQLFQVPRPALDRRWLAESQLKESQPALCYTCHAQVRAQFAQPFHHRVPEGAIKCTDCHNPHGTNNQTTLTTTLATPGWQTCTACHQDKHGPFLFEHAAVKVEGCAICHSPHGAASRFLLNRRESRFLCLQCHGDSHSEQETVGTPHSRLGFQTRGDCTRCHVAIHGSNLNKQFIQ